eukprot:62584-Pyramimonas_sp.AAC.1
MAVPTAQSLLKTYPFRIQIRNSRQNRDSLNDFPRTQSTAGLAYFRKFPPFNPAVTRILGGF